MWKHYVGSELRVLILTKRLLGNLPEVRNVMGCNSFTWQLVPYLRHTISEKVFPSISSALLQPNFQAISSCSIFIDGKMEEQKSPPSLRDP